LIRLAHAASGVKALYAIEVAAEQQKRSLGSFLLEDCMQVSGITVLDGIP
jgi:hypothetical protein